MKNLVKTIFDRVSMLNPRTSCVSSLGSYVSASAQAVCDTVYREIYEALDKDTLAYKILTTAETYSEKQLWVIAYALEKSAYGKELEAKETERLEAAKLQASETKSKLALNKEASADVLATIKQAGKKLADYYAFVKKNRAFSREFYSKKFSVESANQFLAI